MGQQKKETKLLTQKKKTIWEQKRFFLKEENEKLGTRQHVKPSDKAKKPKHPHRVVYLFILHAVQQTEHAFLTDKD